MAAWRQFAGSGKRVFFRERALAVVSAIWLSVGMHRANGEERERDNERVAQLEAEVAGLRAALDQARGTTVRAPDWSGQYCATAARPADGAWSRPMFGIGQQPPLSPLQSQYWNWVPADPWLHSWPLACAPCWQTPPRAPVYSPPIHEDH